jgi:hypothetical protein
MALSVQRGIYKSVSIASPQAVAGSEATGGAVNLSLNQTFGNFSLAATATAVAPAAVGDGAPAWWWHLYVPAELGRQKAAREARAVQIDDIFIVGPLPFAAGDVEATEPATAELLAVVKLPRLEAAAFVPRLLTIVQHDEPVDDEVLALLAAALLLAA